MQSIDKYSLGVFRKEIPIQVKTSKLGCKILNKLSIEKGATRTNKIDLKILEKSKIILLGFIPWDTRQT